LTRLRQVGVRLDLQTAQVEVLRWLRDIANARVHGQTDLVPAAEFELERQALCKLPAPYRGAVAAARPARPGKRLAREARAAHIVVPAQHDLSRYDALLEPA
jgi:hypothetical protein